MRAADFTRCVRTRRPIDEQYASQQRGFGYSFDPETASRTCWLNIRN